MFSYSCDDFVINDTRSHLLDQLRNKFKALNNSDNYSSEPNNTQNIQNAQNMKSCAVKRKGSLENHQKPNNNKKVCFYSKYV